MNPNRALIEHAIERLIALLDEDVGDPDLEPDPLEEQHDVEADIPVMSGSDIMVARRDHLRRDWKRGECKK